MRPSRTVIWLTSLLAALALVAAAAGLLQDDGGGPSSVLTVRGETVWLYGQGLYRYETIRDGAGFKGVDLFLICAGVPLLLLCIALYRRGSLRGGLLLLGALAYFIYNAASMSFGYSYNDLFLIYLAQLSASLFAFALAVRSFDVQALPAHISERLPRRTIAGFLFAVGISLILVWGVLDILPALLAGRAPALTGHTTLPTHALDMGIIAPLAIIAAVLLLRRDPLGYLMSAILLVVSSVLGAGVLALSAAQLLAGALTLAETMVFVVPFVILTLVGVGLTLALLQSIQPSAPPQLALRSAHR